MTRKERYKDKKKDTKALLAKEIAADGQES